MTGGTGGEPTHTQDEVCQRVLVTGASGFLGSRLCGRLREQGQEVHAISRSVPNDALDKVNWISLDLVNAEAVLDVVSSLRPNIIYHLASYVAGTRERSAVLPMLHCNLVSTVNLLDAVAQCGCRRIVLSGSMEEPDSQGAIVPSSPYAAAKWAASTYARLFYQLYGTPAVILRLFMVYGPGQRDLTKLIPYVILSLLRGEEPRIGSGQRPVDWVYVDDVVDALLAAAAAPAVEGRTIEVGSGNLATIRALVEMITKLMRSGVQPRFGAVADRKMEQTRAAEISDAFELLQWKPSTPLEEGLRQTIAWYSKLHHDNRTGGSV